MGVQASREWMRVYQPERYRSEMTNAEVRDFCGGDPHIIEVGSDDQLELEQVGIFRAEQRLRCPLCRKLIRRGQVIAEHRWGGEEGDWLMYIHAEHYESRAEVGGT